MSHLHPDGFACQKCMDETATLRADLAKAREERDAANSALTLRANEIRGLVEEADKERSEWSAAVLSNLAVLGVPTLCAWCGIPASGADEIRAHVADCKSNPAVSRALAAERARDEAVAALRDLTAECTDDPQEDDRLYQKAIDRARRVLEGKPTMAEAMLERDEAADEVARLKEALEAIENATGLSPIAWTQGDILQAVMARARRALGRTDGEG